MSTDQITLLRELKARTIAISEQLRTALERTTDEQFVTNPAPEKWSIAQTLWHLNWFANHYIPAIRRGIDSTPVLESSHPLPYEGSWLGNYFTKSMAPREGVVVNPMPTLKAANPIGQKPGKEQLELFLKHQEELLHLLGAAAAIDLRKPKISTTLSSLIKIRLGDTFRFYIAHQERHLLQIIRTLLQVQGETAA